MHSRMTAMQIIIQLLLFAQLECGDWINTAHTTHTNAKLSRCLTAKWTCTQYLLPAQCSIKKNKYDGALIAQCCDAQNLDIWVTIIVVASTIASVLIYALYACVCSVYHLRACLPSSDLVTVVGKILCLYFCFSYFFINSVVCARVHIRELAVAGHNIIPACLCVCCVCLWCIFNQRLSTYYLLRSKSSYAILLHNCHPLRWWQMKIVKTNVFANEKEKQEKNIYMTAMCVVCSQFEQWQNGKRSKSCHSNEVSTTIRKNTKTEGTLQWYSSWWFDSHNTRYCHWYFSFQLDFNKRWRWSRIASNEPN